MISVVCTALLSAAVMCFALGAIVGEFRRRWPNVLAAFDQRPQMVLFIDPTPPAALRPAAIRRTVSRPQRRRALAA